MAELKFPYKHYGPGVSRPVIPIEVRRAERTIKYEVLVDSGADNNIFDAGLASILGFEVTGGRPAEVVGITGVPQKYYIHPVTIKLGGAWEFQTEAGFMPETSNLAHGVVGQKGFFEFFKVTFDQSAKRLELKLNRKQ